MMRKGGISISWIIGTLIGVLVFVAVLPTIALNIYTITAANNTSLYGSGGLALMGVFVLIIIAGVLIAVVKGVI